MTDNNNNIESTPNGAFLGSPFPSATATNLETIQYLNECNIELKAENVKLKEMIADQSHRIDSYRRVVIGLQNVNDRQSETLEAAEKVIKDLERLAKSLRA
jgi:hypothetical protein